MVELISLTCPNCSATMQIEKNRKEAYCTYCGTKMIVHNNNEKIVHHIDYAAIAKVDADLEIEMQKMRMAADERRRKDEEREKDNALFNVIMFPVFIFFIWVIWKVIVAGM